MKITLLGAAGEVTGSGYLLETGGQSLLIDFGMFQGGEDADAKNHAPCAQLAGRLDAILVTHAHLDHTGRLPLLVRAGYRGPVFATAATCEFTQLILKDSAKIQEQDAARETRHRAREGLSEVEPLYYQKDVQELADLLRVVPYQKPTEILPGITIRLFDSGHILGSVSAELTVFEDGREKIVVFSGDIGPRGAPLLEDPVRPERAELVFMESTYGDRDHRPYDQTLVEFRELIVNALKSGGKILVPTFAVGRAQNLLYELARMFQSGALPRIPVWVDSPMACEATDIYLHHQELFDEQATAFDRSGALRREMSQMMFCPLPEQSQKLNSSQGSQIIMAGSGMCNAGRIVHHLRHHIYKQDTVVLITGYQSAGTLGRRLVDGADFVRIMGERLPVRAKIASLGGFSAHAGQADLLHWFEPLAACKPRVVLTHGEDKPRAALAGKLSERYGVTVEKPGLRDIIEL